MKIDHPILAAVICLSCITPNIAHATSVYQCFDNSGRRVGWADRAAQCPTGSNAVAYDPPDICVIPGVCEVGPPPTGSQPLEFICCAFVSGDSACHHVSNAVDCPPDEFLASCEWGLTESTGDVTCFD